MNSGAQNWQAAAALYQRGGGNSPILLLTIGKASLTDAGGYPRILTNAEVPFPNCFPWIDLDPVELGQSVNDLEGSSNLSNVNIPCIDGDLTQYPHALTADIAGGYSFPGKTAILWYGFKGLGIGEFLQMATMILDHTDYEDASNTLTFVVRDNSLLTNGYAFIYAQNGLLTTSQNPATVMARPFDPAAGLIVAALADAGFSSGLVNAAALANLDRNVFFNLNMQFQVGYPAVAKDWIENEILKPTGCYWFWNNLGQFTPYCLLPAAPPTVALSLGQGDIDVETFPQPIESEKYTSALTYRMDCDPSGNNPQTNFTDIYAPAANLYGISPSRVIVSRGMRSGQGGMRMAHLMAGMLFRRYGLKPLMLKFAGFAPCLQLDIGDKILLSHPLIPNGKFPAALRTPNSNVGIQGTLWEVLGTHKKLGDATVDLELLHVSWQLATSSWLVAPDSTPAYASASTAQKAKYFFVCNGSNQQSNGDAAHTLW